MLDRGDKVVVAVSGGPDSVCLLSALHALAKDLELTLHVAHLDHRFRGEESAADARFVAGLARDMGIAATTESRDVPAYCAERGMSAQAGAREVRYAFLQQCAKATSARRVAVGHTANDQAETLLMRLVRGREFQGFQPSRRCGKTSSGRSSATPVTRSWHICGNRALIFGPTRPMKNRCTPGTASVTRCSRSSSASTRAS